MTIILIDMRRGKVKKKAIYCHVNNMLISYDNKAMGFL